MSYCTGIIKCQECGKNFNYKNNNGTEIYVCQTRKNRGVSACKSQIVKQQFLLDIIEKHCLDRQKNYSNSRLKLFVATIYVSSNQIKILYKDGTISMVRPNEIIF